MTFKDRQLNSMTFQAWKMKFLNSMTLKVFLASPQTSFGVRLSRIHFRGGEMNA